MSLPPPKENINLMPTQSKIHFNDLKKHFIRWQQKKQIVRVRM